MKKKIFLTSALAMGFIVPAFAEPFPTDGYMAENKTYDDAATAENMDDVYEGSVDAVAEYTDILYDIVAGNYLAAGSDDENGTICPTGSYCPGLTDALYNATADQGIESCPTGFGSSAAGATSANECYRTCSGNVTIEHATGVTGNDYYGTGVDTCEPTGCVNGWHLKSGVNGTAIATAIGNTEGTNSAYIKGDGTFSEGNYDGLGAKGQAYYGLNSSEHNSWAVDYGDKGFLYGQGRCSTQQGYQDTINNKNEWTYNNPTTFTSLTDEAGQDGARYCYCNLTGYKDASGTLQSLSSPWVFYYDYSGASFCADYCAYYCAYGMRYAHSNNLALRAALLGSVGASPAMCEANTITINWTDVDETTAGQNNEGTATYGGDVRTPVKAKTYKGRTFKGWRFSAPEQTTTGGSN